MIRFSIRAKIVEELFSWKTRIDRKDLVYRMSKKSIMRMVGVGMMVAGIGIASFGIVMRSSWSVSYQTPKVYDWTNEDFGQAPDITSDENDVSVEYEDEENTSETTDAASDESESDVDTDNTGNEEDSTDEQ